MSYLIKVQREHTGNWKIVNGAFYLRRDTAESALQRLRSEFPEDSFRLEAE